MQDGMFAGMLSRRRDAEGVGSRTADVGKDDVRDGATYLGHSVGHSG